MTPQTEQNETSILQQLPKLEMIPIKDLIQHPVNVANLGGLVEPDEQMTDSIKTYGVKHAIRVTAKKYNGKRRITNGHRRVVNAAAAGLTHVPGYIIEYETEADEILDLDDSNNERTWTDRMLARRIDSLTVALSEVAKRRQTQALRKGETPSGLENPHGENTDQGQEETGRVRTIVAKRLRLSDEHVKKLRMVFSDVYRDEFLAEFTGSKAEKLILDVTARWDEIRKSRDEEKLSLTKAAQLVSALKEEARAQPKKKGGKANGKNSTKGGKPSGKATKGKPKSPFAFQPLEDLEFDLVETGQQDGEEINFGYIVVDHVRYPAAVVRGHVMAFGWKDLYAEFVKPELSSLPALSKN